MIVSFDQLPTIREKYKDQKIVLGSGVFDLLHCGHLEYLSSLREYGDIVVVLVKSDARVRRGKGVDRPIIPEQDRMKMVDALKYVDYVFVAPHMEHAGIQDPDPMYKAVFESLQPDIFCSTNNRWQILDKLGSTKVIINERFGQSPLRSTTSIIEAIRNKKTD